MADTLKIADREFTSRLIVGTGKYSTNEVIDAGHHFFGRAASVKPHTVQVNCIHTGRLPVRL